MTSVDLLPALAERLERLVPEDGTLVHDWDDVLRRIAPARSPRHRRRRLRLVVVAVALFLVLAAIATGTYLALRERGGDRAYGLTIIAVDPGHGGPGNGIAEVLPGGRVRLVWSCPHARSFCGDLTSIAWSADGRRLAFTMDEIGGHSGYIGLHVVDTVTGRDLQLPRMGLADTTPDQSNAFFVRYRRTARRELGCPWPAQVAWSPDGSRLAYSCGLTGPHQRSRLFVIRADGSGRRQVATGTETAAFPSWSPDGTMLAFATGEGPFPHPAADSSVYVVRLDGSGRRLVAREGTAPTWSPDGRTIAYRASCGLRFATPTGKDVTPKALLAVCRQIRYPGFPAWSPDGARLAFGMPHGVYVVERDGTGLEGVTKDTGGGAFGNGRPAWTPAPRVVHSHQVVLARQRCC